MNRALFLDRDGVLDELVFYASSGEWESPRSLSDLVMIDGVNAPLQRIADAGWLLFIVTNQPSFAKGKTSMQELREVQDAVVRALAVPIAKSYVCFHHPESIVPELRIACDCRKPGTQSLREAARELDVDLSASWMIGDQDSDLACGRAAGCKVALLENPRSANKRGAVEPDVRVASLAELADVLTSPRSPTSSASL
ncbi:MAG TPA: HAD-IIIA family hydrolase [Thermoanaerobaculia bacterium]|jgi:D-glycero-D-manno-heptose 1,7-bisphosphate phosphatase|nr:HAD-IIIA family hydrolase [Thermoanaerobaculia bacterium]